MRTIYIWIINLLISIRDYVDPPHQVGEPAVRLPIRQLEENRIIRHQDAIDTLIHNLQHPDNQRGLANPLSRVDAHIFDRFNRTFQDTVIRSANQEGALEYLLGEQSALALQRLERN
jgi:hypothetical protein